jgi:site-specific DNA recombinase
MQNQITNKNAVAAIRVSTTKQGTDGDSPEAQREQIERFASLKGITIKKFFLFLESASKTQQPMQEAIDYCKNPKNKINLFVIKSIDRFTRGGSFSYDQLKLQLDQCRVNLVDIYGVISSEKVNTLDHLGFEYSWSVYSPSKKSEILEAERSKDELRDIMSRMIGAEIRYTKLGYWMRKAPYGFISEKFETKNGKRCILRPLEKEANHIKTMFELRARGTMSDQEIVYQINLLGFKTRPRYIRDKQDRSKIVSVQGNEPLSVKAMQKLLINPIYAGINQEKWTEYKPIRCVFDGLVSTEIFNLANHGKINISEDGDGKITIHKGALPLNILSNGTQSENFAFRKYVLCPDCQRPLLGSASRGKSGKKYPAYHCSNYGHYFRIPKEEFENTVNDFVKNLIIDQPSIDLVLEVIRAEWLKRENFEVTADETIEERIKQYKIELGLCINKIKLLSSETAIKYLEEDIMRIEKQMNALEGEKLNKKSQKVYDINLILKRVRILLEHPYEIFKKQIDPIKKAQFFGAIFDQKPTYQDLKPGTQKTPLFTGVNQVFTLARMEKSLMVTPRRIELLLPG